MTSAIRCKHNQDPDDCGWCQADIECAQENAIFAGGHTDDWGADAQAADDWANRERS